tara:strand:+ start:215 stop:388 length:174 start_codon:yes stop_codon:yes gene_type:complete
MKQPLLKVRIFNDQNEVIKFMNNTENNLKRTMISATAFPPSIHTIRAFYYEEYSEQM